VRRLAAATLSGSKLDDFARQHLTPEILDFASGAPVIEAPRAFRIKAARAVAAGLQTYGDSAGLLALRKLVAEKLAMTGFKVDAGRGIVITCGATLGLQAAILGTAGPGDEVLVPVPGYEPVFDIIRLAGATPSPVRLEVRTWELRAQALQRAITPRTRAIYLNQPANPTGRILTAIEMEAIIAICLEHDLVVIEDGVYDELFYARTPIAMGSDARMHERVIRVGSFSKTYAVPGWRLGYAAAAGQLGEVIRRIGETMAGGAVAPLQQALVAAGLDAVDFPGLRSAYQERRDRLAAVLSRAGFRAPRPDGGIYVYAECEPGAGARELLSRGIAAMPGSFFYPDEEDGAAYARFCFARPFSQITALESAVSRPDSDKAPVCAA
jgi:N-succinyldiaminopimelate aminotransferase